MNRTYMCIRDYVECEDATIDKTTGRFFATRFIRRFIKGKIYVLVYSNDNKAVIQNEQGEKTEFNKKILRNYFEI